MTAVPTVAVFNPDWPPALAFIRSLGRAGVPVDVYGSTRFPPGRWSRFTGSYSPCPDVHDTDRFVDWLTRQVEVGEIELVAPTSDYVVFAVAEVEDRLGRAGTLQGPAPDAVRACVHKPTFVDAMQQLGFEPPSTAVPSDVPTARRDAQRLGYPVLVKPRSHVGIGLIRGHIAESEDELDAILAHFDAGRPQAVALHHDPELARPMLQAFHRGPHVEIVSIVGCLGPDGEVRSVDHCRKLNQWPGELGVGIAFEPLDRQPFTDRAVDVVRAMIGTGLFEFEVVHDRSTGDVFPIDLNPRGYGEMTLAMGRGHDLPAQWYAVVTGRSIPTRDARAPSPRRWTSGVQYWAGQAVHLAVLPRRSTRLRALAAHLRTPRVGAAFDWHDPLPGLSYGMHSLRHPRSLVRSFVPS